MTRRSNAIRVPVHFVWTTHERLPLIPQPEERRLWRYIEAICREVRCEALAIGGVEDHIHLLTNLPVTVTMAELMKRVKGGSSGFVSKELRGGEWFRWKPHYGAFAVSPEVVPIVVAYIDNQRQHHAEGSVRPEWEETEIECEEEDEPPLS